MADRILFRAHRSQILPALDACFEAVDTRSNIPILGNVLLSPNGGELLMRATDLAIEVETSCDLMEETASDPITVSGAGLRDIVKNLPESAEIIFAEGAFPDQVRIQSGRSRFSLLTLPKDDFPSISEKVNGNSFQLEVAPLIDALMKVAYAIKEDKTRNYLSGAYLHPGRDSTISVVGTDGHNLAVVNLDAGHAVEFRGIIVPIKTVKAFKKLFGEGKGKAEVTISDATIRIAMNGVTAISKLVDGTFPGYERIIPARSEHVAVAPVSTLRAAVSRVCLVANDLERDTVRFQMGNGALRVALKTSAGEDADEDVPINYDGETIDIGFNGRYLTQMLSSIGTQDVEMHFSDPTTPGLFRPTIECDEHYVIMPRKG